MRFLLFTAALVSATFHVNSQILKPMIWLKADSMSTTNLNFRDIADLNGLINTSGAGLSIDSSSFNFNPALYFCGQSKAVEIEILNGIKKNPTLMIVYEADTSSHNFGLYTLKQDTNLIISLSTQKVSQKGKELVYADSTNTNSTVNVLSHKLSNIGSTIQPRTLLIGTDGLNRFKGKIAEVLIFNQKINTKSRRRYESYLALKFAVTLNGSDYYSNIDSCIWRQSDNEQFHFGIAGIGKDSTMSLNQKQSRGHGGKDIVGISADTFAKSNELNQAHLPEGQYLIWGHSDFSETDVNRDTVGYDSVIVHLKRTYRIRCTGDSISKVSTQVVFRTHNLNEYYNPFMRIKTSENTTPYILFPDSVDSEGNVYFNNLNWDKDGSGYDEFSFGFLSEVSQIPLNNESIVNTNFLKNESLSNLFDNWDSVNKGSQEEGLSNNIYAKIYPNPTLGPFSIAISTSTSELTSIVFYDYAGKLVHKKEVSGSNSYLIDNFQLSKGHYFIVIQNALGRKVLNLFIYE
jgi:hypothetical protein